MKRYFALTVLAILLGAGPAALGASFDMPGPKDDLYRALQSAYEGAKEEAASCDPGNKVGVFLNSDEDLPGYQPGQVYGAQVCGLIPYPYEKLRKLFENPDAIQEALRKVKTFGKMKTLEKKEGATYSEFEIVLPVLRNYIVKSWTHFQLSEEMSALHWYQEDDNSQLLNNRGFMVFVPSGSNTKVYLNSYHVIKPEHRLRFPVRNLAPGFTRDHYANYYWAVLEYAQEKLK